MPLSSVSAEARASSMPASRVSAEARWALGCIAATVVIAAAICAINYRIDFYGLFGPSRDHDKLIYENERPDKYLLSFRYIPEHFDALLIGSSVTDNWDTSQISSVQMYNGSISGGTMAEAKLVADNVMHRKKLRVVVLCVYPYMTASHRVDSSMAPKAYWGALASWQLFRDYYQAFLISRGRLRQKYTGYGVFKFDVDKADQRAWELGKFVPETLAIDATAWSQYKELIQEARDQGATVVRLDPPISSAMWDGQKDGYAAYYAKMATLFRPEDPVIDFNTPEFEQLQAQRDAYYDGAHLTPSAAQLITSSMSRQIDSVVNQPSAAFKR